MEELRYPIFKGAEEAGPANKLETHVRHHPHDRAHVDLMQDEYTPHEVALMLGTSLEVGMRAIGHGELLAERKGHSVVCIRHTSLTAWLHDLAEVA